MQQLRMLKEPEPKRPANVKQIHVCLPFARTQEQAYRGAEALRGQTWAQPDGMYMILAIDQVGVSLSANQMTYQADLVATAEYVGPLPGIAGWIPTPAMTNRLLWIFGIWILITVVGVWLHSYCFDNGCLPWR